VKLIEAKLEAADHTGAFLDGAVLIRTNLRDTVFPNVASTV
jgi:uncharacterized protein YjbI with pentapeptide repeats